MSSPTILREGDGYRFAAWDRVLIEILDDGVTVESLDARIDAHKTLYERFPGRVLSLTVVRSGIRLPDATIRKESSRVVRLLAPKTLAVAIVLEGEGFWASAARSALTAIQLLSPGARPMRVVGTVHEAAGILAAEGDEPASWAQELEAMVGRVVGASGSAT